MILPSLDPILYSILYLVLRIFEWNKLNLFKKVQFNSGDLPFVKMTLAKPEGGSRPRSPPFPEPEDKDPQKYEGAWWQKSLSARASGSSSEASDNPRLPSSSTNPEMEMTDPSSKEPENTRASSSSPATQISEMSEPSNEAPEEPEASSSSSPQTSGKSTPKHRDSIPEKSILKKSSTAGLESRKASQGGHLPTEEERRWAADKNKIINEFAGMRLYSKERPQLDPSEDDLATPHSHSYIFGLPQSDSEEASSQEPGQAETSPEPETRESLRDLEPDKFSPESSQEQSSFDHPLERRPCQSGSSLLQPAQGGSSQQPQAKPTLWQPTKGDPSRSDSLVSPRSEHPPRSKSQTEIEADRLHGGSPPPYAESGDAQRIEIANYRFPFLEKALQVTDRLNFLAFRRPYRAVEWCDFPRMPAPIRKCCQNMLMRQWTCRIPLQGQCPASTACSHLSEVINDVASRGDSKLLVVDFCAGGGGPTPTFERLINAKRRNKGLAPIDFYMSDLYPNLGAWDALTQKSANLRSIRHPVDAAKPPAVLVSRNTEFHVRCVEGHQRPQRHSFARIFRLFNLSFHHFDDEKAKQILRSTLEESDGFAIIELQDRRIGCLLMMLLNFFFSLLVTFFWFPLASPWQSTENWDQVLLTYLLILPMVLCWDGVASCLRTREFEEVIALVGEIEEVTPRITYDAGNGPRSKCCEIREWKFTYKRELHTLPWGYVNWITGVRTVRPSAYPAEPKPPMAGLRRSTGAGPSTEAGSSSGAGK
ncbi:hypothetical protein K469DRAFT_393475 [Zopfia rhizophila CBS 207.26]|uniref:Uncharacterized protein n=1 Tax=Zopfia rhizophila CBS 207.26 TaxID=1314779 RepID=A0A6A6EFJ7_9PEZI|nr:hypothetical protein K469DRAFT_393475 [Zopfia rhizophila CBS 207.26]